MQEKYGHDTVSESAKEGTEAHEVAADLLRKGEDSDNPYLQMYLKDVYDRVGRGFVRFLNIERLRDLRHIHPECFGTIDCWRYETETNTLIVWDFKYGYVSVEAYENWQMLCYAGGIAMGGSEINVELRIVQPRAYHPSGPVRVWKLTAEELAPYVATLQEAAEKALSPNPQTVAGSHCLYCKAKHACEASRATGYNYVEACGTSEGLELPDEHLGQELDILDKGIKMLTKRKESLEHEAVHRISTLHKRIPGWGVGPGRGRKVWLDEKKESVKEAAKIFGVPVVSPESLITPTQAISAGIPKKIIEGFSKVVSGGAKLRKDEVNVFTKKG
jgi:hypothetical protein